MSFRIVALVMLLFAVACSPDAERAQPPAAMTEPERVVTELMEAFNAHDPDKMRDYWHGDVAWFEISGDQTSAVTTSASQLHGELVAYFEAFPTVSSSLENITVNGNYLTAIERPTWEQDGERKSQASVVVYEITDNKVKRFWYYPPQ